MELLAIDSCTSVECPGECGAAGNIQACDACVAAKCGGEDLACD